MKTAGCKQKGRLGQKEVVKILLKAFPELTEDDIRSTPMGSQGEDIMLSSAARKRLPWDIEVKRGKRLNLVTACKQAEHRKKLIKCTNPDCVDGVDLENFSFECSTCVGTGLISYEPVALGRYDRDKKWYAVVELDYLLKLMRT